MNHQPTTNDTITILDFGGQYAHLIANRIRRLGVHAIIKPYHSPAKELKNTAGIILSGGPQSVNAEDSLQADPAIFELGIPMLGICYGHQLTTHILGGKISPGETKEYGKTTLHIDHKEGLFKGIETSTLQVWMSHWDEVTEMPTDFEVLAHTDTNDFAAVGNESKKIYGIQFHPEVTHTEQGMKILNNFVDITGVAKTWDTKHQLQQIHQELKDKIPADKKVFVLVSGGVDSMVAFSLLNKELGEDRVYGLHVDTGFMRKNETAEIKVDLDKLGWHNLHIYDAKEEFFTALEGVYEPEAKRKIIGNLFINIQAKAIKDLGLDPDHWILAQGTIYPDTIETGGTEASATIKTHHNRVPEIQAMIDKGLVIEPLKDLYKDEVRELGEMIGLSHHLVWRHPFPGPGLAIRILCSASKSEEFQLDTADINQFLNQFQLQGAVLPIQSVGVQGDIRTYRHPLAIFPNDDKSWRDHWDNEKLQKISTELTNRFDNINRVIFSLTDPIENPQLIPEQYLTEDRTKYLQEADRIVMNEINEFDLEEKLIWQCPTVLLPISLDPRPSTIDQSPGDQSTDEVTQSPPSEAIQPKAGKTNESLLIRPISSIDAMTADFALMPEKNLSNILKKLDKLNPSAVFYDLTNKPPGTIEWE